MQSLSLLIILVSYYECDSCNSKFSKTLESHMSNYMKVFHTLSQVRGKKGVPSYVKGGEKSGIRYTSTGINASHHKGEKENFIINEEEKTITFKVTRDTYIPIAIYKCLTKMALTIIDDDELPYFQNAIKWINEEDHNKSTFKISDLKCIFSLTPGPLPHDFTTCLLFKRKEKHKDNVPYMQFLLAYGNFTFQIYLPMSEKDPEKGTYSITPIPTPFDLKNEFGAPKYSILNFTSTKKIKNEEVSMKMSYESMEENQINEDDINEDDKN